MEIINAFPAFLRNRLEHRNNLQKFLNNTLWLCMDKVVRMGMGFVLTVFIARYLGPDQFGLWSFVIAFTGFFSLLGFEGIIVRDIVNKPEKVNEILGSAFVLNFAGNILLIIFALVIICIIRSKNNFIFYLTAITAGGYIFQSFNIIDFYFKSQIQSKYTVLAQNFAFLIIMIVKILLIVYKASVIAFAWASLGESFIGTVFLIAAYKYKKNLMSLWICKFKTIIQIFKDGWPLIISWINIMIYMKINQIMLGQIVGNEAVGIYSAGSRLSEIWYFIPIVLISSAFPVIIDFKKSNNVKYIAIFQKFYDLMICIAIPITLLITIFSKNIVILLYGPQYQAASGVLCIHIWTSIFVFLGVVSEKWFLAENLNRFLFNRTFAGAVLNIFLNIFLIPKYGFNGAATATLISQAVSSYFFDLFNYETRQMFFMKTKAILFLNLIRGN